MANPVGMLASVVLMLQHLGHAAAAADLDAAITRSLADPGTRTRDIGGTGDTAGVIRFLVSELS